MTDFIDNLFSKEKKEAMKNAPFETTYRFRVKTSKSNFYIYSVRIYPKKGENYQTAYDKCEKIAKMAFASIKSIEFIEMSEK